MTRPSHLQLLAGRVGYVAILALAAVLVASCDRTEPAAAAVSASAETASEIVANAESAAPQAVARRATILDWPERPGGKPVQVRQGDNGWTCFPDRPETPVNDPMCLDEVWMEWMAAHQEQRPARIERIGLSYMLQGGAAANQQSPFITEPPPGKDWYRVGPHVMIIVPDPAHLVGVSRDTEAGGPFVEALAHDHPIVLMPVAAPGETLALSRRDVAP